MATICINWAIAYSLQRMWSPRNVNGMGFEARGLDCQLPTFPFIHYFPLCALISSMTFFFPLPFALSTGTMFMSFVGFPEFLLMSQTPRTAREPSSPIMQGIFPLGRSHWSTQGAVCGYLRGSEWRPPPLACGSTCSHCWEPIPLVGSLQLGDPWNFAFSFLSSNWDSWYCVKGSVPACTVLSLNNYV